MAVEGCGKFLKYTVFFFNFLVFLGGAAVLGVGIWIAVDAGAIAHISAIIGANMYKTAAYLLIAAGAVVLILGFLGCCGAIKESKCMLGTFFALLFLIFLIMLVGGILAIVYKNTVIDMMKTEMKTSIEKKYGVNVDTDAGNKAVTDGWDSLQTLLKCCGIAGDYKSQTSWYAYRASTWYTNQQATGGGGQFIPKSCCKDQKTDVDKCTGVVDQPNAPPRHQPPTAENPLMYGSGCYDTTKKTIEDNIPIVAGVGIGVGLLMLLAMIFAICLCRSIHDDYQA